MKVRLSSSEQFLAYLPAMMMTDGLQQSVSLAFVARRQ
jgi:hypothetical protein